MSDTESFEQAMTIFRENLTGMYDNGHMTKWADIDTSVDLGYLQAAHDREIRDTAQQEYHRGFEDGQHSMDDEHRAIAMRLQRLPFDGGSVENLFNIARAVYHNDFGWEANDCAALRDELVRLMGGVSDDICDCAGGGACAADCGCDSGEQEEVGHGGTADDCGGDTAGSYRGVPIHMDGLAGYDVLWNERQKAIAELRKLTIDSDYHSNYQRIALAIGTVYDGRSFASECVRDRLIHLLGGDQPSGIDVLREMDTNGTSGQPNGTCPDNGPMASITDELRKWAKSDVWSCKWEEFEAIADRIDERAKHDRESDQLRIEKLEKQRDHWKHLADTNTNALLRIGGENARLHADCERLRKRLDSITETIERIKSIGQE